MIATCRHKMVAIAATLLVAIALETTASPLPAGHDEQVRLGNTTTATATTTSERPLRDARQLLVPFSVELSDDEWHQMMKEDLMRHGVLGQVVDQVPPYVVNVDYEDFNCVHLGHPLTPRQTQSQPKHVNYPTDGTGGLFTLVAIDPDVPNRNNSVYSEFLHWLVVNIPDEDVERGDVLADYLGPLPSQGGGQHRFVFQVFRQTERIRPEALPRARQCDWAARARFSARRFAELHGLGRPKAINYFVTNYDSSVPGAIERCVAQRRRVQQRPSVRSAF